MKILHVVNVSFVLPYFFGNQIDYFSERGVTIYIACQPSAHLTEYGKDQKFIIKEIDILREIDFSSDVRAIFQLRKFIKEEGIDIVISHTPKGGLIGMMASFLAGIKKRVYFRHGVMYETSTGFRRTILKNVERLTGYLATQVVCVSPSVVEFSEREMLSRKSSNLLLNLGTCNGIDAVNKFNRANISPEHLARLRAQYGILPNDTVVGFVGRLVIDKGINQLLAAWKLLLQTHTDIKLLIVGPFEERDSLSDSVKDDVTNCPSIIHTGLIQDAEAHYALMDIFILPSFREGFPTVVLEASAMELPVITTHATGCRDSILENETGVFVEIEPEDIKSKIELYLNDPVLAQKHGKRGRKFVLENFDQLKIWKEIENKILELNL